LTFVQEATLYGGAYGFSLSPSFFPNYEKHMANIAFSFDYRIEIECPENRQITYLSIPKGAKTK
jgi:hypothetical protein